MGRVANIVVEYYYVRNAQGLSL